MTEKEYQGQKINFGTWKRILGFAARKRKYIYWALFFGALTGILDLCTSLFSRWAIDGFIANRTLAGFPWFIAAYVTVQTLFAVFTVGFSIACGKLEANLTADIRQDSFTKLQTMSFSYFDKSSVGYLLARLTTDVSRTVETLSWSFIDLGWGVMAILASLVGMFIIEWRLALILVHLFETNNGPSEYASSQRNNTALSFSI